MNTTMRTDRELMFGYPSGMGVRYMPSDDGVVVMATFARTLERETVHLAAENKALWDALEETERTLRSLAGAELNIDEDRNRTPLRLAMRHDVYKTIERAQAALAKAEGRE